MPASVTGIPRGAAAPAALTVRRMGMGGSGTVMAAGRPRRDTALGRDGPGLRCEER